MCSVRVCTQRDKYMFCTITVLYVRVPSVSVLYEYVPGKIKPFYSICIWLCSAEYQAILSWKLHIYITCSQNWGDLKYIFRGNNGKQGYKEEGREVKNVSRASTVLYILYVCTIVHTLDIYKINNLPDSKLFNSIVLELTFQFILLNI